MRQVVRSARCSHLQMWVAYCAASASALALLVAGAAYVLPVGQWPDAADMITPLTGHILIGSIAALLALRFQRWAVALAAASVALAIGGHALIAVLWSGPQWPTTVDAAARDHLRVYALNAWDENTDLERLERALRQTGADVIVLAEADPGKVAMLRRLKSLFPYQISCAEQKVCAMAILSQLPFLAGAAARNRYLVPPIAWARIDATARGLGQVTVVGTHVHRPTRNPWVHAKQMRALGGLVAQTKGPLIVAGDFNAGPWSRSFRDLVEVTGLTPLARLLPTWPAYPVRLPQVALDNILVSPDLVTLRSGIGRATGSDHLPVVAEIGVRDGVALSAR